MPIQYTLLLPFLYPPSTNIFFKPLKYLNNLINKSLTPLVSEICAECITTANIKLSVSTATCCFIPLIFFPPSYPLCPLFEQSLQFYYLLLLCRKFWLFFLTHKFPHFFSQSIMNLIPFTLYSPLSIVVINC